MLLITKKNIFLVLLLCMSLVFSQEKQIKNEINEYREKLYKSFWDKDMVFAKDLVMELDEISKETMYASYTPYERFIIAYLIDEYSWFTNIEKLSSYFETFDRYQVRFNDHLSLELMTKFSAFLYSEIDDKLKKIDDANDLEEEEKKFIRLCLLWFFPKIEEKFNEELFSFKNNNYDKQYLEFIYEYLIKNNNKEKSNTSIKEEKDNIVNSIIELREELNECLWKNEMSRAKEIIKELDKIQNSTRHASYRSYERLELAFLLEDYDWLLNVEHLNKYLSHSDNYKTRINTHVEYHLKGKYGKFLWEQLDDIFLKIKNSYLSQRDKDFLELFLFWYYNKYRKEFFNKVYPFLEKKENEKYYTVVKNHFYSEVLKAENEVMIRYFDLGWNQIFFLSEKINHFNDSSFYFGLSGSINKWLLKIGGGVGRTIKNDVEGGFKINNTHFYQNEDIQLSTFKADLGYRFLGNNRRSILYGYGTMGVLGRFFSSHHPTQLNNNGNQQGIDASYASLSIGSIWDWYVLRPYIPPNQKKDIYGNPGFKNGALYFIPITIAIGFLIPISSLEFSHIEEMNTLGFYINIYTSIPFNIKTWL